MIVCKATQKERTWRYQLLLSIRARHSLGSVKLAFFLNIGRDVELSKGSWYGE